MLPIPFRAAAGFFGATWMPSMMHGLRPDVLHQLTVASFTSSHAVALGRPLASESHALAACHCMHTRKTCAYAVVALCFTTTFKPYYSSIFGTTLVALSSLQTHAWSLWSFTCFRICCSHLCTLTFVLLYVSSHICALICVLLLSFHVMPCSICSSLHYLGSLAGVIL